MFNYYNVSCHSYADDTHIYFNLGSKDQCVSKLNTVLNAVQTWMFKRKVNLINDKTNMVVVGNSLRIRNSDFTLNLKTDQSDVKLSTNLRNLGIVF